MYASLQLQGQTATTQELPSEINGKKAQAGATTLQLAMPGIPNAISVWIIDTPVSYTHLTDGGYAIIFDASKFEELLNEEVEQHFYQGMQWGDVYYYGLPDADQRASEEIAEAERKLRAGCLLYTSRCV